MAAGFKTIFLVYFLMAYTSSVQCQRLKVLADIAFDQLQYAAADSLYKLYFDAQKDTAVLIKRAYCSMAQGKYKEAAINFELTKKWVYKDVSWCEKYASALCKSGQVDSCAVIANRCITLFGNNESLSKLGTYPSIIAQLPEDISIHLEELSFVGQSTYWSPVPYENKLLFTAPSVSLKAKDAWTGVAYTQLYSADMLTGENNALIIEMAADLHTGSPALLDKNMMYFTSNSLKPSKYDEYNLHIAIAGKTSSGLWVHSGIFPYSSPEYSTAYPCFSTNDSIMIFSSDKMGGKGGFDLYMCKWTLGKWDEPIHMKEISTTADDVFPWIDGDDTLYFSTEAWVGLGGLDIFKVSLKEMSTTPPTNIGLPYNSVADDFGFIRQGDKIFISSSRSGMDKIYKSVIINNH